MQERCAQPRRLFFNAVTRSSQANIINNEALLNRRWVKAISGALTTQVLYQYIRVWELVDGVVLHLSV